MTRECAREGAPPPAMELARQFIDDLHGDADPGERAAIEGMILCAGQFICDEAGPGVWEALDAPELLRRLAPASDQEATALCLYLVGFVGWMSVVGHVGPELAARVASGVMAFRPGDPILADLCLQTIDLVGRRGVGAPIRRAGRAPGRPRRR